MGSFAGSPAFLGYFLGEGFIFLIYGIAIIVFGILIAALGASIEIIVAYFGIALGGILMGIGFLLDRAEHPKHSGTPYFPGC